MNSRPLFRSRRAKVGVARYRCLQQLLALELRACIPGRLHRPLEKPSGLGPDYHGRLFACKNREQIDICVCVCVCAYVCVCVCKRVHTNCIYMSALFVWHWCGSQDVISSLGESERFGFCEFWVVRRHDRSCRALGLGLHSAKTIENNQKKPKNPMLSSQNLSKTI